MGKLTDLELEMSPIKKAIIKDVNNYIVVKDNGEVKVKGVYADEPGTRTHAYARIASRAVMNHLFDGKPIEDTVKESKAKTFVTLLSTTSLAVNTILRMWLIGTRKKKRHSSESFVITWRTTKITILSPIIITQARGFVRSIAKTLRLFLNYPIPYQAILITVDTSTSLTTC
jgi:hypothetical protein